MKKYIPLTMITIMLICFGACSGDSYYEWSDRRGSKKVIGFINDSLVMVSDTRCWIKYEESLFTKVDEDVDHGCGRERLCVYNYRVQEDGPRWCDSLLGKSGDNVIGQITDSVVWGGDLPKSIQLWKVGETQHQIKLKKSNENCLGEFGIASVKQWLDGTFIIRGDKSLKAENNNCQYAILDTLAKTITYKRLDKELEWVKDCDDVRAWDDDVYCFMPGQHAFEAVLLRNEKDAIPVQVKFTRGKFWGDMVEIRSNICKLRRNEVLCLDLNFSWRELLKFYKDDEVIVNLKNL